MKLLPYQPRRRVPWSGWDILLVLLFFFLASSSVSFVLRAVLPAEWTRTVTIGPLETSAGEHPAMRLLRGADFGVFLAVAVVVVVVAPVAEEFFFRVLLQGWLEALQRRYRRQMPTLRRIAPGAAGPIVLTSLLFGGMHLRGDSPPQRPEYLLAMLAAQAGVYLCTLVFAVGLMRLKAGATAADLGWAPAKLLADVRLGLAAFMALAIPIYLLQFVIAWRLSAWRLPRNMADPVTLFFFALALGILYHRTHRIAPSLVVHVALNATSLAMAWWLVGGK
ncbi:MAG: CPBP family glutamic-type intramembrane protease [Thermoguttaceae bacterium]|jgi:membrane protease YdiL (CAAX protease family)